jgi:hypothetical protein
MNIQYLQIKRPYSFTSPFKGAEFAALIYIADANISIREQEVLSDQIVISGCRYAVCAGLNCSSWDNSIDMADIKRNGGEVSDENLVMTTWHDNETLEDIAFFFLNNTSFGSFIADRLAVLVIGANESILNDIQNEINKRLTAN